MHQRFVKRHGGMAAPPLAGVPMPHHVEAELVQALLDVVETGISLVELLTGIVRPARPDS